MKTCDKCGDWRFNDSPTCPCKLYRIIYEGEESKVYGKSPKYAVEKFAIGWNDEGQLIDSEISVMVDVGGEEKPFRVSAEMEPVYTVTEL